MSFDSYYQSFRQQDTVYLIIHHSLRAFQVSINSGRRLEWLLCVGTGMTSVLRDRPLSVSALH